MPENGLDWASWRAELMRWNPALAVYLEHSQALLDGDELTIQVLTPYRQAWLERRLRGTVEAGLQLLAGRALRVVFVA